MFWANNLILKILSRRFIFFSHLFLFSRFFFLVSSLPFFISSVSVMFFSQVSSVISRVCSLKFFLQIKEHAHNSQNGFGTQNSITLYSKCVGHSNNKSKYHKNNKNCMNDHETFFNSLIKIHIKYH